MSISDTLRTSPLSEKNICLWLEGQDDDALFSYADDVRRRVWGDDVYIRGIVELSNHCTNHCLYCGLRCENTSLKRFRLEPHDVYSAVERIYNDGIHTVVLQSGDDPYLTCEMITSLVQELQRRWPEMYITLSLGERPDSHYRAWRNAGAARYLIKHETADTQLYAQLHPGQSAHERLRILDVLRAVGYEVGTGCMVGLPGQTITSCAQDILFFQEWQPEMAGIGPFIPHAATPLATLPAGTVTMTRRMLALARIVAPHMRMPATTALGSVAPDDGLALGLRCGCNVIMCDYTPDAARTLYNLYDNKKQITYARTCDTLVRTKRRIAAE